MSNICDRLTHGRHSAELGAAHHADVIIVGSGPAGVSAAWPLVEAGLGVLMLDASNALLPASPPHATLANWRADPERWRAVPDLGSARCPLDRRRSCRLSRSCRPRRFL